MDRKKQAPATLPKPRSPRPISDQRPIPLPIEAFEAGKERHPDFFLQLERKKSFKLAHEQGAGNPCNKCGDECPGFDLHFWRKICRHCKCGKQDHNVADEDNFHTVERLLGPRDKNIPKWTRMETTDQTGSSQDVQYAWVPPGVTLDVAKEYMDKIPLENQPIRGSEGDRKRKEQLQKQVPAHDMDDSLCHALSPEERVCLQQYVENVKQNAVGQGSVRICKVASLCSTANSSRLSHTKHPPPAPFFLRPDKTRLENQPMFILRQPLKRDTTGKVTPGQHGNAALLGHTQTGNTAVVGRTQTDNTAVVGRTQTGNDAVVGLTQTGNAADVGRTQTGNTAVVGRTQTGNAAVVGRTQAGNAAVVGRTQAGNAGDDDNGNVTVDTFGGPVFPVSNTNYISNPANNNNNNNVSEPPSPQDWPPPPPPSAFDNDANVLTTPDLKPSHMEPPSFPPPPPPLSPPLSPDALSPGALSPDALSPDALSPNAVSTDPMGPDPMALQSDSVFEEVSSGVGGISIGRPFWRDELTAPVRDVVVLKVVQTMYPDASMESITEMPTQGFASFVQDAEAKMYEKATSLDDYCDHVEDMMAQIREEIDVQGMSASESSSQLILAGSDLDGPCHKCKKVPEDGDVVVVAEKANGQWWHPRCFQCTQCGEMLVDLIYFHHQGELYCGRHYAEAVSIPRCHACDELIFSKEYTLTAGATYHVKHFCCFGCDNPLADQKYVVMAEQHDQPHCLPCYTKLFGKVCRTCRRDIGPDEPALSHVNLHFHASAHCFRCDTCQVSLLGGRFLEAEGQVFCSKECKMKKHVVETAI